MSLGRVAVAGLLLGMAACTSVRPVQPAQLTPEYGPDVVWVTRTNNTVLQVVEPVMKRDTLRGKLNGERVRIPLSEIRSVQAKLPDHKKTAILFTTVGVGVIATMYVGLVSKAGAGTYVVDCTRDDVTKHPDQHPECGN